MILFYCGYYLLEFSVGMIWWTTAKLWNGVVYVYKNNYAIEYKKEEDLKKEIMELKELIKSTTRELNT
jgi:hypothetical protein